MQGKTNYMRGIGIALIIIGILMFVFNGFNIESEKQVAKVGPIEVNKKETRHIGWPVYGGAIAVVAGVIVLFVGSRKDL